jgi:hypothetical protein
MTIVGGFICSFVFLFALLALGNMQSETGWPESALLKTQLLVKLFD